jgi:hypothetical protein
VECVWAEVEAEGEEGEAWELAAFVAMARAEEIWAVESVWVVPTWVEAL